MDNYIKPAFLPDQFILNHSQIFITTDESSGVVTMMESDQGTTMVNVRPGETVTRTLVEFKVQSGRDRSKGLKIKAEQLKQIAVFGLNDELHSTDAFTALPCSHLPSISSYEYYAVSVPLTPVIDNTAQSAFLIVACSDSTTVSITPSQTISHPYIPNLTIRAGTTFSVQLQERQTLYVQDREDLTGSKVVSSAPISFFTGHECGNVPAGTPECDHLVEQIPPTATWGNRFLVAPTATRRSQDLIRVIAAEDNTSGNAACVCTEPEGNNESFTLSLAQAGNFMEFNLSSNSYCSLETDKPVLMVQFTAGGSADGVSNGDPFMVIVPAVKQYLDIITFTTITGHAYTHYANLFVPAGFDPSGVIINSSHRERTTTGEWVGIKCPYSPHVCGYAKQISISHGINSIWNSKGGPVGVTVYGFSYLQSYAYVGGLKLTVRGNFHITRLFTLTKIYTTGEDTVIPPTSYFAVSGSSLCLQCNSGGKEPGTLRWSKDGRAIGFPARRQITTSSGFLCIKGVRYSDAGNYVCHVPTQGLSFSTILKVTGKTHGK